MSILQLMLIICLTNILQLVNTRRDLNDNRKVWNVRCKLADTLCWQRKLYSGFTTNRSGTLGNTSGTLPGKLENPPGEVGGSDVDADNMDFIRSGIHIDQRKREDAYTKTDAKDYPYALSLTVISGSENDGFMEVICSGTLLTAEWVLTSAHCFPENFVAAFVQAGGNTMMKTWAPPPTVQVRKSLEYYLDESHRDIALIKVPERFNLTDTVHPINVSTKPWNHRGYRKCVTTAFGAVSYRESNADDFVRKTQHLEVKQPCLCAFAFNFVHENPRAIDFLCAKPMEDYGVCSGDSGGGLVCDGQLVGVNMELIGFEDVTVCEFNFAKLAYDLYIRGVDEFIKCGGKNTLSVFQSICPSLRWINDLVGLFSPIYDPLIAECIEQEFSI